MAVYRGEDAIKPAPIHYLPSTLQGVPLACGEKRDDLPFDETVTYRLVDATCSACLDSLLASP